MWKRNAESNYLKTQNATLMSSGASDTPVLDLLRKNLGKAPALAPKQSNEALSEARTKLLGQSSELHRGPQCFRDRGKG